MIALGVMLLAGIIAASLWYQPHPTAEGEKGTRISAAALQQAYSSNETAANARYLDKVLEVTGTVAATEKNQDGKTVIYLDDALTGVGCTLRDAGVGVKDGQPVVVKGFCSGSNGMGVALRECVLVQ